MRGTCTLDPDTSRAALRVAGRLFPRKFRNSETPDQPIPTAENAKNRVRPAKMMLKIAAIMIVNELGSKSSVHQFGPGAWILAVWSADPCTCGHQLERQHHKRGDESNDGEDFEQSLVFFDIIIVIIHLQRGCLGRRGKRRSKRLSRRLQWDGRLGQCDGGRASGTRRPAGK